VLVALLMATPALAETVHLIDERQVGVGWWANTTRGSLAGNTVGVGRSERVALYEPSVFATVPLSIGEFDLALARSSLETLFEGSFSYDGTHFPVGASGTLDLTFLEAVWRFYPLDRQHLRLVLLPGVKFLQTDVSVGTNRRQIKASELNVLPEIGAMVAVKPYPRSILFGLVKWFDWTDDGTSLHQLQLEGGLSYLIPAPSDDYVGWRITGGARYRDLSARKRIGKTDQVSFGLESVGPFLEVSRVF